jgi:hypothetical protein
LNQGGAGGVAGTGGTAGASGTLYDGGRGGDGDFSGGGGGGGSGGGGGGGGGLLTPTYEAGGGGGGANTPIGTFAFPSNTVYVTESTSASLIFISESGIPGEILIFTESPSNTCLTSHVDPQVIHIGETFQDTATLSQGTTPTGTLTFSLSLKTQGTSVPIQVQQVPVNGNGDYTATFEPILHTGLYQVVVEYSGDSLNAPTATLGNDLNEQVRVIKFVPDIDGRLCPGLTVCPGHAFHCFATLLNGHSPTGFLSFDLYRLFPHVLVKKGTVPVSGNGQYRSPRFKGKEKGFYCVVITYSGDERHSSVATAMSQTNLTLQVSKTNSSGLFSGAVSFHM